MKCNNVLVVEDDPGIREALQIALEMEGYKVATAIDGRDGLTALKKIDRPCLILLDLMMPIMDGWAFAESLQDDMVLAPIPIVVVTAFADRAKSVQGARAVLKKPIDVDLLVKIVHQYCDQAAPSRKIA